MTTKFISDMGPKSALIAPRPFKHFDTSADHALSLVPTDSRPDCSTSTTRSNLQVASKACKKKMNFYITKYNKSMQKKLRSLKTKSPRDYWK